MTVQPRGRSRSALYVLCIVVAVAVTLALAMRPDGVPHVAWQLTWLIGLAATGYYAKERRAARLKERRDDSFLYQRNYNDDPGSFR